MSIPRTPRIVALSLAAIVVAAACSSSGSSPSPSTVASQAPASAGPSMPITAVPTPPSADVTLQGAGATFPAPLYQTWFETYSGLHPNIKIDYQAVGSGAGIKAITQQTVDFGATDAAMKDEEIAALPSGSTVVHIPTALGAVVVIYNLPGVATLNLDAANVADIFLATITNWNDPKIAANNPGMTLPDKPILVVHRSDGSGTTNAFTSYLAAVSPDWNSKVGAGKEVNWPIGIGAKGNDGVAGGVQQNEGAVGYVELNYASQAKIPSANIKNADGKFVPGSTAGVTAAADSVAASFPADSRQAPIINAAGADTYPIAAYTYLLVYQDQKDATRGQALVAFIAWALTDGQALEEGLGYAPLPAAVQDKALATLRTITTGGSLIWP
ncbi:MAG: phosphate ABC transporter substrate-binding protein PstS [Chloroflexota bacterium]